MGGGGGWLPSAENWTLFCRFWYSGTRTVSTPTMYLLLHPMFPLFAGKKQENVSFICWEEAGNFTKADTKYVTTVI